MAQLPIIEGLSRVVLVWTHSAGQRAVNVMHFQAEPSESAALATLIYNSFTVAMWGTVVNAAHIDHIEITPLDGISGTRLQSPTAGAQTTNSTGQSTGDMTPAAAVVVKQATGLRGKSHNGRIFLPFTAESDTATGFITSAKQGTMNTAWENFRAAMATGLHYWSVASYKNADFNAISSVNVELPLATQRRRQSRLR